MRLYKRATRIFTFIIAVTALTGCAVQTFKSNVVETPQIPIRALDVYWNPTLPANYRITMKAYGSQPTITDRERKLSRDSIEKLSKTFEVGFRSAFSDKMKLVGVTSAQSVSITQAQLPSPMEGRYQLFLDVERMSVICNGIDCSATFDIKGLLRAPAKSSVALTFTTEVGQAFGPIKTDGDIFQSFVNALTYDFNKKGFLKP